MTRTAATLSILVVAVLLSACGERITMQDFDIQGHRGARGILPENTIPAFIYAIDQGVTTLELDVVVSADQKVVVSHDPWFNPAFCSHPDGRPMTEDEARLLPLYALPYEQISQYDCGLRQNPRFPEQRTMAATKPLLLDLALAVKAHIDSTGGKPLRWNIETKSTPDGDDRLHPRPQEFVELLHADLEQAGIKRWTTVQSFDVRTLQAMRALDPEVELVLLVASSLDQGIDRNLEILGFVPEAYSPDQELVTEDLVGRAHDLGMLVIPWTVNRADDMERLRLLGVDGLITDYPNRARAWKLGE